MKKIVIIPARYQSTRLPGKPLQDIEGKPMIVRVCETVNPDDFNLVVATDDTRIKDAVENAGFSAVMTRKDHTSGTDRLFEASEQLALDEEDIVINLQGDEPLMPQDNLLQVSALLEENPQADVATLFEEEAIESIENPNMVKLVQADSPTVLYFSRAPIPFDRDKMLPTNGKFKRHVGVYAYRKSALNKFVEYSEGALEKLEKLEQLRFLENGHSIVAARAGSKIPVGVDTQEDLDAVRALFRDH